jgi:ubiquinone/menaquinone biosynthesis C-methylase UbiE
MFILKVIPARFFSRQARKPTGIVGQYIMTRMFNKGNARLNEFLQDQMKVKPKDRLLEIGFGPGKLLNDLAETIPEVKVDGIDFSSAMVKQATKLNQAYIEEGRVNLRLGDSKSLPYPDNAFSIVFTSNTIYFWDEPKVYLTEILRILRPGGQLYIGFRAKDEMDVLELDKEVFTTYSTQDVTELLVNAGFTHSKVNSQKDTPFTSHCATGAKPL